MDGSRESSPDWLRSFQVPSHSPLTLSSDSGSLHDGSASIGDKTDDEGPPKFPRLSEISNKKSVGLGISFSKSAPRKTLEETSLEIEGQIPSKIKKLDNRKAEGGNRGKKKIVNKSNVDKPRKHKGPIHAIWTLSSDSESCHDHSPERDDINQVTTSQHQISHFLGEGECGDAIIQGSDGKSPSKKVSKEKSLQNQIDVEGHTPAKGKKTKGGEKGEGNGGDLEVQETSEKHIEPNVSTSRLPLLLSDKVQRAKALVECEGDSIDLSGDMGAVGRVIVSDSSSGDQEMHIDLKGTIYKTSIVPSRTFCIVSFGQSEAKLEAIMNDFIQLKPLSNVYEAETMVEGTLDGFSFDSDEEAGKMQKANQNEHTEDKTIGKSKANADKKSGTEKKRGRNAGGKPQPKIARKKTLASKRAKTKK